MELKMQMIKDAGMIALMVVADTAVAFLLFLLLSWVFSSPLVWTVIIAAMSLLIRTGLWDKWDL